MEEATTEIVAIKYSDLRQKVKSIQDKNHQEGFVLIDDYCNFHLPVVFDNIEAVICDENSPRFGMSFPLSSVIRN